MAGLIAGLAARAADLCPVPPHYTPRSASEIADDDHLIHVESDNATIGADGNAVLDGHVALRQDARNATADVVTYDKTTGRITVRGAVDFLDPKVRLRSTDGVYEQSGVGSFDNATYQLFDRSGRGYANQIELKPGGKIFLTKAHYTTCPEGNQDWMMSARTLSLDTVLQKGTARDVTMDFKGVPILYLPYFTFPMGDERKSGFLIPTIGHSGTNGFEFGTPYYFNLAPNYDLTLTPEVLTARGVELTEDFRFLTAQSHGVVDGTYLPYDRQTDSTRSFFHMDDVTDFTPRLRGDANVTSVSDSNYFQDFAVGSAQTSVTYLERRADLLYQDDAWRVRGELQNFETIDTSVALDNRPYARVPRIDAEALWPLGAGFDFGFNGEAVNFVRDVGPQGLRLDLAAEMQWSLRTPGYYVEPAVGWRFTQYDLSGVPAGDPGNATRTLPYARLDTGMIFERDSGANDTRTQTLEPRLVYSYVPYRNQNDLQIFDTAQPDLNLTELFRTARYVGADRVGDMNLLSMGLTTRLFDQNSGQQYMAATIGQIHYFSIPQVTLPGQTPQQAENNDVVGNLSITAYKNWTVNLGYQWDPDNNSTGKSEFLVQYRPDTAKVVNLAYRYQPDLVQEWDGSVAWPVTRHWNVVGRWVYSILDKQTIEQVEGVEYKSCCWKIDLVQRRYVNSRNSTGEVNAPGPLNNSIGVEFELIGLSSVAKPGNSFMERSIGGYSPYGPAP